MGTKQLDIASYLAGLPLFQEMSPAELERLAHSCQLYHHLRGEEIFRVGQPCEEFHVVVTGQVKLYVISSAGHEKVIELIAPGHTFAEPIAGNDLPLRIIVPLDEVLAEIDFGALQVLLRFDGDHGRGFWGFTKCLSPDRSWCLPKSLQNSV